MKTEYTCVNCKHSHYWTGSYKESNEIKGIYCMKDKKEYKSNQVQCDKNFELDGW